MRTVIYAFCLLLCSCKPLEIGLSGFAAITGYVQRRELIQVAREIGDSVAENNRMIKEIYEREAHGKEN